MSTRERRQREFQAREQLFLDQAHQLVLADGLLKLHMGRLAEITEYAIGTLYQHFDSKEDLLVAMATVSVQKKIQFFQKVAQWKAPSRDRMFAIAAADMFFSLCHPEHFRLVQFICTEVIWEAASDKRREAALEAAEPASGIVLGVVQQGIDEGDLKPGAFKPMEIACGPWSICTGMHTLVHARGLLERFEVRRTYLLMLQHVQHLMNGIQWKPKAVKNDVNSVRAKVEHLKKHLFADLLEGREIKLA